MIGGVRPTTPPLTGAPGLQRMELIEDRLCGRSPALTGSIESWQHQGEK